MRIALVSIILGLALISGLIALGRVVGPFAEETSRLTESNSVRRVDGVNQSLSQLCLNMRLEQDLNTKRAFATLILTDADSFQRQDLITPSNRACIAEARSY